MYVNTLLILSECPAKTLLIYQRAGYDINTYSFLWVRSSAYMLRVEILTEDKMTDWFDRYKFCQPLGQGGMGTIYLAEDRTNDNKQCVIKQLHNKYADPEENSEAIRLFKREASILRSLNHLGIVRVFDDYTTDDGRYFLVMDYIKGKSLDVLLNNHGPFACELAIAIAIQCCEVLEYLHGLEPPVIYRDCKPSNLMLTPDGRIVFIDFGIAKAFTPKEVATRVVTAGYSPPEQYFGKPETRSDLYSLGATLFHLLTGKRPKPLNTCEPRLHNATVLESVDRLVRRLTAHDLDNRPSTARSVRFELYKSYKELHPEFELPGIQRTDSSLPLEPIPQREPRKTPSAPASICTTSNVITVSNQSHQRRQRDRTPEHSSSEVNPPKGLNSSTLWQLLKKWLRI